MKKKILGITIIAAMLSTGCGSVGMTASVSPSPAATPEPTKIGVQDNTEPGVKQPETTPDATPQITQEPVKEPTPEPTPQPTEIPVTEEPVVLLHPEMTEYVWNGRAETYELIYSDKDYAVHLKEEDMQKWPELGNALEEWNDLKKASMEESYPSSQAEALEWYRECKENDSWYEGYCFADEVYGEMIRSDSVAFSILQSYYGFWGGVHGYYSCTGVNYDTESGNLLRISDVVSDMDWLYETIYQRLMENNLDSQWVSGYLDQCREQEEILCWLITYDGITFIFNPYDVASYAEGMQIVELTYRELDGRMVEKYARLPEYHVTDLTGGNFWEIDIDGDGNKDHLTVNGAYYDEYGNATDFSVELNNLTYAESSDAWNVSPYLVYAKDKVFLYVFCIGSSDYAYLEIFDLTGGTIRKVAQQGGALCYLGGVYTDSEDSVSTLYTGTTEVFTDPMRFALESRLDALSTTFGRKTYYLGEDGIPVAYEDYYDVSGEWRTYTGEPARWEFTTLTDLEMYVVDENRNVTERKITVNSQSKLWYIRTDGESYADFILETGEIVRADINCRKQTICGIDVFDALDGIIFAG